jgi:hypothetical protein
VNPLHQDRAQLEDGLAHVDAAPKDGGAVELIVRRPALGEREVLESARLDPAYGLVGDTWRERWSRRTADGSPHPDMQLTIMSARAVGLIAGSRDRWALAGDQLYLDLYLSEANLPIGARLAVGDAVVEVTDQPHTGCAKFSERFGLEALRFVNSAEGRSSRLRGINARVVVGGTVTVGDVARVAGRVRSAR